MAEYLHPEEEDLLQSALSTAFVSAELPRLPAQPSAASAISTEEVTTHAEDAVVSLEETPAEAAPSDAESADDAWKAEYEMHLEEWRAASAAQRHKAEEERARWRALRESERRDQQERAAQSDVRALAEGETQGERSQEFLQTVHPGQSPSTPPTPLDTREQEQASSDPESSKHDKWEDIPSSLTSSYPSMSFPSDPHSLSQSQQHHHHHDTHASHHAQTHAHAPIQKQSTATLSVFDSTLSPRTRALALLSSVAINVLLPFVNGVMLGFGEIFAKNVIVGWLGWKVPGSTAANVGLQRERRRI